MSFLSRMGKGALAHLLTGSFSGGMVAALTDNFGTGLGAGMASRLLQGMNYAACSPNLGGYSWGGWGTPMSFGSSNALYDAAYNNFYDQVAWSSEFRY